MFGLVPAKTALVLAPFAAPVIFSGKTEIKAPSAGVIGKIFVKPGDTVKPGNPLFFAVFP